MTLVLLFSTPGSGSIFPPLLTNSNTLFGPTVAGGVVALLPPLLSDGDTIFAPVVSGGGSSTLAPPLLTNSITLFSPVVNGGGATFLLPPFFTNTSTIFAPHVTEAGQGTLESVSVTVNGDEVITGVPNRIVRGNIALIAASFVSDNGVVMDSLDSATVRLRQGRQPATPETLTFGDDGWVYEIDTAEFLPGLLFWSVRGSDGSEHVVLEGTIHLVANPAN